MARIDKIEVVEKEILWADRKRILGMPISFTRYSMDEDRLYVKKGLLRMELNEILLYRILDVRSTQTLWQRIFGVGTLTLYSADQSCPQLLLKNIKRPEKLHRYLSDVIEKNRQSKGIAGREIVGMAAPPGAREVAFVRCTGGINAKKRYDYVGVKDCISATKVAGGPLECSFGCLGFGSCVNACQFGAMSIGEKFSYR